MIGRYTTRAMKDTIGKEKAVYKNNETINKYLDVRSLEGLSAAWMNLIRLYLQQYLSFCNNKITKNKTIEYLKIIQNRYNASTFRKHELQIRRFLRYCNLDYMEEVKIISEPEYIPIRITEERILEAYNKVDLQYKALIKLGASTGLRPSELYRLKVEDINLLNRSITLKGAKDAKIRTVFFTPECRALLEEYIKAFERNKQLKYLFGEYKMRRGLMHKDIEVRHLRKFFIQQWHRKGGNPFIGEILMGHSTKQIVSLRHYISFNMEEMKKEYDRIIS
jgi:integrase